MERREFLKTALVGLAGVGIGSAFGNNISPIKLETKKPQKVKPQIALTIDDGWFDREKMVNIVNHYGVPANFFIIGRVIEEDPKPWINAIENGHELGCHTYYHNFFSRETISTINEDFSLYAKTFIDKLGSENFNSIKHFRYPYGDVGNYMNKRYIESLIKAHGWDIAWWDLDLSFYHRPRFGVYKSPIQPFDKFRIYMEHMEELSMRLGKPTKTKVLMHFKYPDDLTLRDVIEYSLKQGYEIKRLSDLEA